MQRALILIAVLTACTVEPTAPPASEPPVRYLTSADFANNLAVIETTTPFRSFGLHAELPDAARLEIRVRTATGEVRPWQELPETWREDGYRTIMLVLDAPATALELRADLTPAFVRVELSETEELLGEHEGAHDDDDRGGERSAHPGIWQPPAGTLAAGDSQYLPYVGATGCSGTGLLPGTRDIANMLRAAFPGATSYGGYACRKIAGSNNWSVHSTGRAVDLFIRTSGGQADNDLGDPVANWLIENAEYLGISFLVWDRGSWGAHRPAGNKHRYYSGVHPHHDHIHIEVTQAAAARGTQWFHDGMPSPGGGGCRPKQAISCNWADWIVPDRVLHRGEHHDSCDGRFYLTMQHDGNLVLYQREVGALWSSGTHGTAGDRAVMQSDGNLVVYAGGTPLWSTGTSGNPGAITVVQSDGNLVLYAGDGTLRWASGTSARPTPGCAAQWLGANQALGVGDSRTSCDGRFQLLMQGDGNLVLYQRSAPARWSTGTNGSGAASAAMQGDGNLVLYRSDGPVWASGTNGHPGAALAVQSDGNLVVYGGGLPLWGSGTAECP